MSLVIQNNVSALNTQRNLSGTSRSFSKSLEKLSSGYKINVASDDPSGLIISEQLRSQISGLGRAVSNSQEASNVLGIAEGALIEMNNILRKMRSLALHAANSGVTAPDQIRADQSEVDSGIQTLDRIANTTRYSDQFLLNGSKGLVFDRRTTIDEPMDHPLLNLDNTRIDQVFKREGARLSISFNGTKDANQAEWTQQARRAYFESNPSSSQDIQILNGRLTAAQSFTVTGTQGSRQFRFGSDTELGAMVAAINNVSDSIGVGATLMFDSSVTGVQAGATPAAATRATTHPSFYNYSPLGVPTHLTSGVTQVARVAANYDDMVPGLNLDGEGRFYVRFTGVGQNYIAYKDQGMTMEIGRGVADGATDMTESNNSGVNAAQIRLTATAAPVPEGTTTVIQLAAQLELNNTNPGTLNTSGLSNLNGMTALSSATDLTINNGSSALSGVRLGHNTDENGGLYFEIIRAGAGNDIINIYKDSRRNQEHLVAQATGLTLGVAQSVRIYPVNMDGGTGPNSGLHATLNFGGGAVVNGSYTGSLTFDQVGLRLFSNNYGSTEYVRVQNHEGQLFGQYQTPENTNLLLVEEGQTVQQTGRDATITVNGQPLGTQGLTANITTASYSGSLVFNQGTLGETTIAQVGHDIGSLYSRGTSLQAVAEGAATSTSLTWATNARKGTTETLENFIGGMQYQLGEGEGDQERTVYGIPSMAAANLGRISIDGTTYSLQDILAGGMASLSNDPITALRVVSVAINDVSELRARLGAFQANMLQTNINSLEVAIQNITMTESAIRDANMAAETTDFTKNQILLQAGTSMLAQANQASQSVLQLLG